MSRPGIEWARVWYVRGLRARASVLLLAVLVTAAATDARAAGLWVTERGVRPLARGGAFVAGADDLHALWYNPAGLFDANEQLLIDGSVVLYSTQYTRRANLQQVDPNTGETVTEFEQVFPAVQGETPPLPIPTIAGSIRVHPKWVIGFGAMAPYAAITNYPETVEGKPAPQRYSLISLDGSALGVVGGWAAYAPNEQWRVGFGVQLLLGAFQARSTFNACIPDRFLCAPEQPEWDTLGELRVGPLFSPSGNAGVIYRPHERWRIGASFQLPFFVRSSARIRTRLPTASAFNGVEQSGEDATVSFEFPYVARLGVQYEPVDDLFVEVAGSLEGWSMHDAFLIDPIDVKLRKVVGFPDDYDFADQRIVRGFRDSFSVRLGGEYAVDLGTVTLQPRLGGSFESSAVPPSYLSVMTIDADRFALNSGVGVKVGRWRFDAGYTHVFTTDVAVEPEDALGEILMPIRPNPVPPRGVNGGDYRVGAHVLGLGLAYELDTGFAKD